ncbi:hypothetical protein [Pseudoalteromonas sp. M8]|uniref:hypothetical protein n=1 Tax=Pseudoalteromonas sp. M8 TaxID=2692624 RepID=UPI001BA576A5|nr:hypothetical protein [Pseudoalteromonas sp. M8]QUI72448.1 hypothetical protein GSF13_23275 [Pseudoalteromonas sp. M8]
MKKMLAVLAPLLLCKIAIAADYHAEIKISMDGKVVGPLSVQGNFSEQLRLEVGTNHSFSMAVHDINSDSAQVDLSVSAEQFQASPTFNAEYKKYTKLIFDTNSIEVKISKEKL